MSGGHCCEIEFGNETFLLHTSGAIFWPAEQTLLIADLHLGKGATLGVRTIPIPETSHADLLQLSAAIDQSGADRVIVLGDFIHHRDGLDHNTDLLFRCWREQYAVVEVALIRGNHDASVIRFPHAWQITDLGHEQTIRQIRLAHYPAIEKNGEHFTLCGHLHPKFQLTEPGGHRLSLRGFWKQDHQLVLPAFSKFIDSQRVAAEAQDTVYLISESSIFVFHNGKLSTCEHAA